ncbi:hypothetical protein [Ruegeria aquimaris]|uniref:Hemolysin, chromosomal n=1 Tax=Ruegeria aquimaris TaxID=2984333 RepID=A0ABT3AQP6_9RHOB|nr:hypothetical protein [Ruegeria sp. XHP0148]MCV2890996.1 hypothetical protein [Ruegeria sp. XHP0148]
MSATTDRTRNISANPDTGDIPLAIAPPPDSETTITILSLPEIGDIILPGAAPLAPGQEISADQLSRLAYRPDTTGAGSDLFTYQFTETSGRRTEIGVDVTTTGALSGTALYFRATSDAFGRELWRLLPTGQVAQVADIYEGPNDGAPNNLTRLGDTIYFSARTPINTRDDTGAEPWRVGPDGVVVQLEEINPGPPHGNPNDFTPFMGTLYFEATNEDTGYELYRIGSDGNAELVADINPGPADSIAKSFTVYGDALYFSAKTDALGTELWRVTASGEVEQVRDIKTGSGSSSPGEFTLFDGALYFAANGDSGGSQLWRVDPDGVARQVTTQEQVGFNAIPRALQVFDDQLWFQADDPAFGGAFDLYRLGAGDIPELVHDFRVGGLFSEIREMQVFGNALYFTIGEWAEDGSPLGNELWRAFSDGTVELVADINPGGSSSSAHDFIVFGTSLYFTAEDGIHGRELWRVDADGIPGLVRDLNPGEDSGAGNLHVYDGALYFVGNDGLTGSELWRMTADETFERVADIHDGPGDSYPGGFVALPIEATIGMSDGSVLDDVLFGSDAADRAEGGPGNDRMSGLGGNDSLDGGLGADTLNGGDGDDIIIGGPSEDDLRDVIYAGEGNDSVDAGAGNDLIFGQGGNDTIAGGFGVDEIQGQDGDDVITGSAFSDLVFGGAGNDFVNGGFGHDRINGGSGADKFFHVGVEGHGSDWVQDYSSAEGDVLLFGNTAATRADFQVNFAHTQNAEGERAGDDAVQEAFVIYRPTGQIMWALVDGQGQSSINLQIGSELFDLLT